MAPLAKNGGPQKKSWTAVAVIALFVMGFLVAGAFGSVKDSGSGTSSSGSTDTATVSSSTDTTPTTTSAHATECVSCWRPPEWTLV